MMCRSPHGTLIVNPLCDVLRDVAGRAAMLQALGLEAVLLGARFVACVLQPVTTDDDAHAADVLGLAPEKPVPMGRSIVVRLGHPHAENAEATAIKFGTGSRPGFA